MTAEWCDKYWWVIIESPRGRRGIVWWEGRAIFLLIAEVGIWMLTLNVKSLRVQGGSCKIKQANSKETELKIDKFEREPIPPKPIVGTLFSWDVPLLPSVWQFPWRFS